MYSEEFGVGVGVHHDNVLSQLLFIVVLAAISREFHTDFSWKLLCVDDQIITAYSMEALLVKVQTCKMRWSQS